ncbi:MAG: MoaD/ThiS family protein [Chloroflexi bacterium]|nr:MoaD/ThiS family protein [Chloroflexota bacterium]
MARVLIPLPMRDLTAGQASVNVSGATVAEVIEALEATYPGMRGRLMLGEELDPALVLVLDGRVPPQTLSAPVGEESELRFLPAVGGG